MKKKIKIIDLLCYMSIGGYDKLPERFCFKGVTFKLNENKNYVSTTSGLLLTKYLDNDLLEIDLNAEAEVDEEILDEEDEFEDIEEIPFDNGMKTYDISTYHQIERMTYAINDLINNQKKIIERLNNRDNN